MKHLSSLALKRHDLRHTFQCESSSIIFQKVKRLVNMLVIHKTKIIRKFVNIKISLVNIKIIDRLY